MKLYIFILALLSSLSLPTYSQAVMGGNSLYRHPRNITKKQPIDTCLLKLTYSFKFSTDTISKSPLYDKHVLEIGKHLSHYYSSFAEEIDSIYSIKHKTHKDEYSGLRQSMSHNNESVYEDIFTNFPNKGDQTIITGVVNMDYGYIEPISKFNWNIHSDIDSILGYQCQKATTDFGGRKWTVWFTLELPIQSGPWKFNGLPGMVIKATDRDNLFQFILTSIEKPKNTLIYRYNTNPKMLNKDTYRKILTKRWMSPIELYAAHGIEFFPSQTYDSQTNSFDESKLKNFSFDYFPLLELE